MSKGPVYVTQAFLPPKEEYLKLLDQVFETHVLTNNGPLHRRLEAQLRERMMAPHLLLMANGTLAIQLAIRALNVTGEVITTPFSYVATTSAVLWEGCTPVFVDIRPDTLCIDPALIEAAITPRTSAILATHVYGIPCDVEAIDAIAKKHRLKVIYDAAHAFDVEYKGRPITAFGDASTLSFHATKLFHTVEGGATIVHSSDGERAVRLLRSFGHVNDDHFSLGMNAKMSEVHAAMGLAVLPHINEIVLERARISALYDRGMPERIDRPVIPEGTKYNFSYYPVLAPDAETRIRITSVLSDEGIHVRRYFYPSLDALPYVSATACAVSRGISDRVLCLPLYAGLPDEAVESVLRVMNEVMQSR